ncbi:MAG: hypothetical protein HKN09_04210 [Saprospiraceae bacterium]|nr:hypothetical protein [Saprospiraceae bacterium]
MKPIQSIASFLLLTTFILSCKSDRLSNVNLELDERYASINSIQTIANCTSPAGQFVTEVNSKSDGDCLFIQNNDIDSSTFIAHITPDNIGFILDENHAVLDTLSDKGIEMIKGHEIHRIMTSPESFYNDIRYNKTEDYLGTTYPVFSAEDGLNNPIKIFYNPDKKRLKKIELVNPLDTSQIIEIVNNTWMNTSFGKMPKEVDIIQAKKDTYRFSFIKVDVN